MQLTLHMLRCPDPVVPESRRSAGSDLVIGRGSDCDWVLDDPARILSKRHCVLEFRGGYWQVRDTSTNGTHLNHAAAPIGRDKVAPVSDGDRLSLGSYEIEIRIEVMGAVQSSGLSRATPTIGGPDPNRPAAGPQREPLASPFSSSRASPLSVNGLPQDWDPFADEPPMRDFRPASADAFRPPVSKPLAKLPDDWDIDLDLSPPVTAPRPSTPGAATPTPAPMLPQDWSPFDADPAGSSASEHESPHAPPPGSIKSDPFAEAGVAGRIIPSGAADPAPAPAVALAPDVALAALLRGAGLSPAVLQGTDPLAAIERAGAGLRAAMAGLRTLLIARAEVKREFRIEQTMLRGVSNNPVKFAATEEAALAALLAEGTGLRGLAETVEDLTAHQVASLAATQAAARALLQRLAPAGLEAAEAGSGLFGAREKRLWEAYRRLHTQMAEQFDDEFDSAFGREFARAYEQAIQRREGRS